MRRDRAEAEQDGTPGGVGGALSITVELVTGRGQDWWPRPGRVFAASSAHTFADLAEAIDVAFGRRDLPDPATAVRADLPALLPSWRTRR